MSNRFNMVSERDFPPLMANMATISAPATQNNRSGNLPGNRATTDGNTLTPVSFNHSLSIRLNDHNFLLWKQQVLAAIKGNRLQRFIFDQPPAQYLNDEDRALENTSSVYSDWEVQDQLLVSWLLSSMTESLLTRMVGCNTAKQIWDTLEKHFALQVSSKILEFRTKLQQIKKGRMSLNEYLLKVKQMVDLLASVGEKLSARDHIAAIFKGLPSEYDTFVISSNTRIEGYSVAEIEALLLSSESRIEKKDSEIDLSAHIAVQDSDLNALMEANVAYRNFRQQQQSRYNTNSGNKNAFRPNYIQGSSLGPPPGFSNHNSFNNQFFGRGNIHQNRPGRLPSASSNIRQQCQLCLKLGHTVHTCFYRFDKSFTGLIATTPTTDVATASNSVAQANLAAAAQGTDESWYPDSGATNHCTPDVNNLSNCTSYDGLERLYVGDGSGRVESSYTFDGEAQEWPIYF